MQIYKILQPFASDVWTCSTQNNWAVLERAEPIARESLKFVVSFQKPFYALINKIGEAHMVNGARDFRLMRRNMVDAVLELSEYNRFSKGIFSWVGFDTEYIALRKS